MSGVEQLEESSVRGALSAAVTALGGEERSGQIAMAEAVATAMVERQHLLVQAGTGTGKSLGYLVPAMLHDQRVVVATATLALQHQLVERDIPRLVEAIAGREGVDASYAVLKGRSNYACLHRVREGVPDEQGALDVDLAEGTMGKKVLELREWVESEASDGGSGEKDNAPRHTEREWRQVSVSARECVGATKCPFGQECFAELAREKAQRSHIVVTNHSLLAIDAIGGIPTIPDYDVVVVDEAHELTSRVTQASTAELWTNEVERAARRAMRHVEGDEAADLADAADGLRDAITLADPGRFETLPQELSDALQLVRDAARACLSAFPKGSSDEPDAGMTQAKASVQELFATTERMAALSEADVLWRTEGTERIPPHLRVAPLEVRGPLREKLLGEKTAILTSATLKLGGDFTTVAASVGLRPDEQLGGFEARKLAPQPPSAATRPPSGDSQSSSSERSDTWSSSSPSRGTSDGRIETPDDAEPWVGLDVGSPFDYGKQGIRYVARHLPPPGRDGLGEAQLAEIAELVDAADGRTLGLFSSRRAAETAAEAMRERLPHLTTLAQGDAQLPELSRQFLDDPHTILFGTLGLWQGLDVPGDTCQLVIIDRIPFPRPDDPLLSARQQAVQRAGGNGFMQVAATHAALLLAQGTGRLIRTSTDRGVVAVLDPRLATARYGSFLVAGLPPMWQTTDPQVVRKALARLSASASAT